MVATKCIRRVILERDLDDCPDLSWIGCYKNQPGPDDRTIDRKERGDMGRHEYRYFIAANSAKDTGCETSVEEDYQRFEAYNRNDWQMVGVRAVAEVQLAENGPIQRITSGGLWGIESDAGDYFRTVENEQLAELRNELELLEFTTDEIDEAFGDVERE